MAVLVNGIGYGPVQAPQDAMLLGGLVGETNYILPYGGRMALSLVDANTLRAADGVLVTSEGKRIQNAPGTYDDFSIPSGAAGEVNYYIIGYHLYVDTDNSEQVEVFTQAVASASATIEQGALIDGDADVYVSRAMVKQDGTTLTIVRDFIDIFSGGGSGSGGGGSTPSGDDNVYTYNWFGVTVTVSIIGGKLMYVNCYGNVNQAVNTKGAWKNVADLSSIVTIPRAYEGYFIINTMQTMRYHIDTSGILKFGQTQTIASGSNSSLSSGYAVKNQFMISLV